MQWDRSDPHPDENYPPDRRLYLSQSTDGVCSIAHVVSRQLARRILLELGLERADKVMNLMQQDSYQGGWKEDCRIRVGALRHCCLRSIDLRHCRVKTDSAYSDCHRIISPPAPTGIDFRYELRTRETLENNAEMLIW